MDMHEACPVCHQITDIEVGFYYGTGYVSYVIALLITIIYFLSGYSRSDFLSVITDSRFGSFEFAYARCYSTLADAVLRVLWLSWFVKYDPDWEHQPSEDPERIVKEQMNNW